MRFLDWLKEVRRLETPPLGFSPERHLEALRAGLQQSHILRYRETPEHREAVWLQEVKWAADFMGKGPERDEFLRLAGVANEDLERRVAEAWEKAERQFYWDGPLEELKPWDGRKVDRFIHMLDHQNEMDSRSWRARQHVSEKDYRWLDGEMEKAKVPGEIRREVVRRLDWNEGDYQRVATREHERSLSRDDDFDLSM